MWVAIDSIYIFVFAFFFLLVLNAPLKKIVSLFIFLTYAAVPVAIIFHFLDPDQRRTGYRSIQLLPVILPFYWIRINEKRVLGTVVVIVLNIAILAVSRSRTPLLAATIVSILSLFIFPFNITKFFRIGFFLLLATVLTGSALFAFEPTRRLLIHSYVRITGADIEYTHIYKIKISDDKYRSRKRVFEQANELMLEYQPFGMGYRNFASWGEDQGGFGYSLHNSYQTWLLEGGLFCFLIVVFLFYRFFVILKTRIRKTTDNMERAFCKACGIAMISVFVFAFFHHPHQNPPMYMLLGMVYALPQRSRRALFVKRLKDLNLNSKQE